MATVDLRVRLGCILEELPPVCLHCGEAVDAFTVVHMTLEQRPVKFRFPLCLNHLRRDVILAIKHAFGDAVPDRLGDAREVLEPLLDLAGEDPDAEGVGKLLRKAADDNYPRGEKAFTFSDAADVFATQLQRLRGREAAEFEAALVAGPRPNRAPPGELAAAFAGLEGQVAAPVKVRPPSARQGWGRTVVVALVFLGVATVVCGLLYTFMKGSWP